MTTKYVTWKYDEETIARVKAIAEQKRISVGDLADWLITLGLDQIDAGTLPIVTHEDPRYKRLLDRGPQAADKLRVS